MQFYTISFSFTWVCGYLIVENPASADWIPGLSAYNSNDLFELNNLVA
jgi:hypothetical protein